MFQDLRSALLHPTDCDKVALIMEPDGFIDTIQKLVAIIGIIWGILVTWNQGWETVRKAWAWACSVALFLNKKKTTVVKKLRQMIDSHEAGEPSPTPPEPFCINEFDTVHLVTATSISTSMSGGGGPFIRRL